MKFEKEIVVSPEETKYILKGIINEFAQFGTHSFHSTARLNFLFDKIEMINSTGIVVWINWLTLVQQANPVLEISYSGCPKVIVDQMNKIKGFLPETAIVRSFDVPFYCKSCGKNLPRLVTLGKEYKAGTEDSVGRIDLETMSCPTCKQPMEYDFISDKYFKFLTPLLRQTKKKN